MNVRFLFLISFVLLVGSWATSVNAENHFQPGKVFENFIHIKETNTQIPLPPGKWEVAATTEVANNISTYMLRVILFQETGGTLSRVVYFHTPLNTAYGGYQESKYCSRDNLHYRKTVTSANGGDQECRWINHFRTTFSGTKSKLRTAAGIYLRQKNITTPNHMVFSGYRFADDERFLNVWYMVNPQIDGYPNYPRTTWKNSPWHPHYVVNDPKKKAYIENLKTWTDQWNQRVKAGFNEKLTGAPISSPTPVAVTTKEPITSEDIAGRLKKLDALFKQELISKDEYEQKRKEILKEL